MQPKLQPVLKGNCLLSTLPCKLMKTDLADRLSVVSITLSGWQSGVLLIQAEGGVGAVEVV